MATTTETGVDDPDPGESTTGAGETGAADSSTGEPSLDGAPTPNTDPEDQAVDVLGSLGVHYWFAVDPAEVARMNARDEQTYADHLFVTTPGEAPQVADYGKVQLRVVGGGTHSPWTESTAYPPNLKLDTDEFAPGLEVGGVEHLRFNHYSRFSFLHERLALAFHAKLGYPAPRTTHAWVGSSVWGPGIELPYTVVEVYKRDFCEANAEALGGGCKNIWEFDGDFGYGLLGDPDSCQISTCDNARALELEAAVLMTPAAAGYKAALADWIAWDAFHQFQCLSWLLGLADDALHNAYNMVLVERLDGRFQYLPYSVDTSAWDIELYGSNTISRGCQADPECWQDTIATCEVVIAGFVALDPTAMADTFYAELEAEGMLHVGDDEVYQELRAWYEKRVETALTDLDQFREPRP